MSIAARQAARPSPNEASGCLASASRSTGAPFDFAAATSRRASVPGDEGHQRTTGGIIDRQAEAAELDGDAAGEAAIRGDQRRRPARLADRLAHGERDGDGFLLLGAGDDQRDIADGRSRDRRRGGPVLGGFGRAHRFRDQADALGHVRCHRAERDDLVALHANGLDQLLQAVLRMARRRAGRRRETADRHPAIRVELRFDARHDHGAIRQMGNDREKLRDGGNRAGRARGDDQAARRRGFEAGGGGAQQMIAADGGIGEAALPQEGRPLLADDAQEIEGDLPVSGEIVGNQRLQLFPGDARRLYVVDQPGEIAGEMERIGGRGRHQHAVVFGEREQFAPHRPAPGERQPRQHQQAVEPRDRLGEHETAIRIVSGGFEDLVFLVDIADRPDRRQDGGAAAEPFQNLRMQRARGAAGRHENGDIGKRQRILSRIRNRPEPARKQRIDEGRQKGACPAGS